MNREKVSELLDYILKMPPEGCSHDRGHKYPFLANEVFSSEVNKITSLFFNFDETQKKDDKDEVGSENQQEEGFEVDKEDEEEVKQGSPQKSKDDDEDDDFERASEETSNLKSSTRYQVYDGNDDDENELKANETLDKALTEDKEGASKDQEQ